MKGRAFYLVASLIFISFKGLSQWKGWQEPTVYSTPQTVRLLHIKDITGDRKPDLVTFFSASELSFAILNGKGDGSFSNAQTVTKEDNYHLSDVADLDKDGHPDLVISSYWNNGFKIYFGKGNNQFKEGIYMPTDVHGRNIKCVDINKDGNIDIVTTTSGSGRTISLHVFLNKGDGTFHPKQSFLSVLDTCKEIYILDKNGDGLQDVAVSSSFPWFVIFMQQPDGTFMPTYQPTFTMAQLAFDDLNKDGKEDVVLMYSSFDNTPDSDSIVIRLNTGGDEFATSKKIALFQDKGIRPAYFRMADVNKDGYSDLLFNHLDAEGYTTDSVFYMLGKANMEFGQPAYLVMPAPIAQMQVADLNDDGYPEWIISCTDSKIYIAGNGANQQSGSKLFVEVSPNPAKNNIKLKTPYTDAFKAKLYSTDGRLAKTWQLSSKVSTLNIEGLSSGIYFLEVIYKNERKTTAVMIE